MEKIKFTLTAAYCKKLFAPLFLTINRSTVLPILEDILICKKGDSVFFTSSDLETFSSVFVLAVNECPDFSFCLSAYVIKDFLSNAIDRDVLFDGDSKKITISSGGFSLSTVPDHYFEYPKEPELVDTNKFTVRSFDFLTNISNAIPFCSNDDLRPAMTGVLIKDEKGKLTIVSTNAHILYFKSFMDTPEPASKCEMIIPEKSCRVIVSMFKGVNSDIIISFAKTHVEFSSYGKRVVCRIIDAGFPDYRVVIPKNDLNFYFKRKQLVAFLKLSERFVNKSTGQINIQIENGSARAVGGDSDFTIEFDYTLPVYNQSENWSLFAFTLNIKFLTTLIKVNKLEEFVKISHSGMSMKGLTVDDSMIIMPLMLNS